MIRATVCILQILFFFLSFGLLICFIKAKSKKSIALCFCCVVFFSFLTQEFTKSFLRIKEEIKITALNQKNDEAIGTEVDILSLYFDGDTTTSYEIVDGHWYYISDGYSWRPPEDIRWDGSATNTITLKIPVGWDRAIRFYCNLWRGYVKIEKPNGTFEVIDTCRKEDEILNCPIGRSDTKLLLLQGIVDIISYAVFLGVLTTLLILSVKRKKLHDEPALQVVNNEKKPCNTKKLWTLSFIITICTTFVLTILSISNLHDRIKTDAIILAITPQVESTPITKNDQYIQSFYSNGTFNQIQLQYCSFGRENESCLLFYLKDAKMEHTLKSWQINCQRIGSNIIVLELENSLPKGNYRLVVEGSSLNSEMSGGVYLQDKSIYNGELFSNGELQNNNISLGLSKETHLGLYILIAVFVFVLICLWITYIALFILKIKLWKVAFILIMGFGIIYIAIFPSGCINDAWNHYVTAYQYCNDFLKTPKSETGTVMMRKDDCQEFLRYRTLGRFPGASIATYYEEFDEFSLFCQDETLQNCGEKSLASRNGAIASITAYFPQVLGLTLGRILSLGTIPCMLLARCFQVLAVGILVSISIKLIPEGKELLLLVALLPIFMQQITAFSHDGIAFGFSFLLISICTKLKYQLTKASASDYMILLIATIGLCACRGGMYAFLLLLLFLIPNEVLGVLPKAFVFGVGFFTVFTFFANTYLNGKNIADSSDSLAYGSPFKHPLSVCLHFTSSVVENIDEYWGGAFGLKMGWSETILPFTLVFGFILLIFLIGILNPIGVQSLDVKSRVIYFIIVVLVLGFCLGTMYLGESWAATKWNIWGVQGRYLLPVIPLISFQLKNAVIVAQKDIRRTIIYIFCILKSFEIFYLMRTFVIR